MKNIASSKTLNCYFLMNFVLKSYHSCWRKYAFYVLFQEDDYTWKGWAEKKYG